MSFLRSPVVFGIFGWTGAALLLLITAACDDESEPAASSDSQTPAPVVNVQFIGAADLLSSPVQK